MERGVPYNIQHPISASFLRFRSKVTRSHKITLIISAAVRAGIIGVIQPVIVSISLLKNLAYLCNNIQIFNVLLYMHL